MNNKNNNPSLPMLLALASNASDRNYPRDKLLREVMLSLSLRRDQLALILGVRPSTLGAWLAPGNPRGVPDHAIRLLCELLLRCSASLGASGASLSHPQEA